MRDPKELDSVGNGADWKTMQHALEVVGQHLKKPTRLVVIGSSVGMFYGQPGRMTEDVDVWSPKSDVDLADIDQACRKAGVTFDPRGYDDHHGGLYLQMVRPGVVHVGKWKTEESMFVTGNLTVVHPPAANIIASKMVRGSGPDVEDAVYLMRRLGVSMEAVRDVIGAMPATVREMAEENMVLLEVHDQLSHQAERVMTAGRTQSREVPMTPMPDVPKPTGRRPRP